MERSLDFSLAQSLSESDAEFDTSAEAVRRWIDALPLAHIGQASRRIFVTLTELNRRSLPPRVRFDILHALETPLEEIFKAMMPYYLFRTFPLPEKSHKVAELATALHRMMVIGYMHIHHDFQADGWLAKQLHHKFWVNTLSKVLRHAEGILLVYRGLGLDAPKNLWSVVHTTYAAILEHNWESEEADLEQKRRFSAHTGASLQTRYSRLLLLTLLNMQQLRLSEFKLIYQELDDWASALSLHGIDERKQQIEYSRFTLSLTRDEPPQILGLVGLRRQPDAAPPDLVLDMRQMHLRFKKMSSGNDSPPHHQRDVLKLMFRSWCEPPRNIEARHNAKMNVEVFFGFSNLHRMLYIYELLWGNLPVDQQEVDRVLEDVGVGVRSNFEEKGILVEELDPWAASGKPERFFEMRDQEIEENEYRKRTAHILELNVVNCKVLNVSDHGYRITTPAQKVDRVSPGELVALRDNHHKGWRIGSVRWVSMAANDHLILGIQVHFEHALPLLFRTRLNQTISDALPCLLASIDGLPVLIVPQIPSLSEKTLLLEYGGKQRKIEIKGPRILGTASFETYNICAGQIKSRTHYRDVELTSLAEMLMSEPTRETDRVQHTDESSKFDDLFSQLR